MLLKHFSHFSHFSCAPYKSDHNWKHEGFHKKRYTANKKASKTIYLTLTSSVNRKSNTYGQLGHANVQVYQESQDINVTHWWVTHGYKLPPPFWTRRLSVPVSFLQPSLQKKGADDNFSRNYKKSLHHPSEWSEAAAIPWQNSMLMPMPLSHV